MAPNQSSLNRRVPLKVALIGQSAFAVDVFHRLRQHGHVIVGIFTVPDKPNGREDVLAKAGAESGVPVFKIRAWRKAGKPIPEVLQLYRSVNANLNVLPYCTQFIPMEVIDQPRFKSIVYHPSLLPRHRGASAINWTLICGDQEAGLTVFWADDGLDTGPILLQEKCAVDENDTVDTLYKRFLYPAGVAAMSRSVDLIAEGAAPRSLQPEKGATYDPMLNKPELQKIDWSKSGLDLHNFIRGLDSVPGAACSMKLPNSEVFQEALLYGSSLWSGAPPVGATVEVEGAPAPGLVHEGGLLLTAGDGVHVNVKRVKVAGRTRHAADLGKERADSELSFTEEEGRSVDALRRTWAAVLGVDLVEDDVDFFAYGAGSMDVVRLVEETKEIFRCDAFENEDVFLAPTFGEFSRAVVAKARSSGGEAAREIEYRPVHYQANSMQLKFPCQLFIDGRFVDAERPDETLTTVNPADESVICEVQRATRTDVDRAVAAAKAAFECGEWSKMSARERGRLMYRLADLMHEHRAELATLESVDSGAVYTLALKTHVGMSVETWRYFAGWADKIQGATIPISNARPNRNLSFTKKEPIGVCGLITPWNYPLMMLSWKMAACLAAGNTVVIKPAQVCPLTALKFAELSARAGFPPGVINVLPGTGSVAGNAIATHPDVRKLGFTGSTGVGKAIMRSCADSNLKKVSLELGGKSPLVVFADCDLDKAVRLGMQSVFFNKGENCIAAGRLFVEEAVHDEFVRRVVAETKKMAIGHPLDRGTAHGPQNHLAHLNKLLEYVQRGVEEGAVLNCGGVRDDRLGYFFKPAVFTNVQDHMFIAKEESFGPIMMISKFENGDMDGVLRRANATEYGLAAGVFTRDLAKALSFAERVDSGTVFVNTYNKTDVAAPFGGFKQSGFGKDLGQEALNEYLKTKCVTIEY